LSSVARSASGYLYPACSRRVDRRAGLVRNEVSGLGRRFRAAVDATVIRISANPQQFPIIHKNVRRALLRLFPYALMFVIEADGTLTVIACFHGSRDPAHWQKRA